MDVNLNTVTGYVQELRSVLSNRQTWTGKAAWEDMHYARSLVDNIEHDLDRLYKKIEHVVESAEEVIKR
jgi:hypothetical protein